MLGKTLVSSSDTGQGSSGKKGLLTTMGHHSYTVSCNLTIDPKYGPGILQHHRLKEGTMVLNHAVKSSSDIA